MMGMRMRLHWDRQRHYTYSDLVTAMANCEEFTGHTRTKSVQVINSFGVLSTWSEERLTSKFRVKATKLQAYSSSSLVLSILQIFDLKIIV